MKFSPIAKRRLAVFRRQRLSVWSLWIFLVLFGLSLCAEFIANDRPMLVKYKGEYLMPIFNTYPEKDVFDGALETDTDFTDPWVINEINAHGWMVKPIIPFDYNSINFDIRQAPAEPDRTNWLGTDDQGRDVLARALYGFRLSILFALLLTFFSSIVGIALGAIQGYFGGKTDLFLQRFIEIWHGMPVLFLLIIIFSIVAPSFWLLLGMLLLFSWMALVDLVRAEFLKARNYDYVRAAKALGVREVTIIWRHVLPNALVSVFTFLPFILGGSITTLATLDFLGFGLPASSPSLGELLSQGKSNPQSPWLGITAFMVLAVMLSLLVFIGQGVRNAFDPRKTFARKVAVSKVAS